jgi:hypothetical protein
MIVIGLPTDVDLQVKRITRAGGGFDDMVEVTVGDHDAAGHRQHGGLP